MTTELLDKPAPEDLDITDKLQEHERVVDQFVEHPTGDDRVKIFEGCRFIQDILCNPEKNGSVALTDRWDLGLQWIQKLDEMSPAEREYVSSSFEDLVSALFLSMRQASVNSGNASEFLGVITKVFESDFFTSKWKFARLIQAEHTAIKDIDEEEILEQYKHLVVSLTFMDSWEIFFSHPTARWIGTRKTITQNY